MHRGVFPLFSPKCWSGVPLFFGTNATKLVLQVFESGPSCVVMQSGEGRRF
jgi:hypothetical protein